jgi:hypothetical protein
MLHIDQQPDDIPGRPIIGSVAVALATIVAAAVVVWVLTWWLRGEIGQNVMPPAAQQLPEDVNGLEVPVFGVQTAAERQAREARERLATYGWIDAGARRVHIPIEVAIELLVAGGSQP